MQGIKNFSKTAANLLASMTKIDNSYYPEVLLFVVFKLFFLSQKLLEILFILFIHYLVKSFSLSMQTLHCMYIVNAGPGFKRVLWPAAQKFLDAKTLSKIHVRIFIVLSCLISVCPPSSSWLKHIFLNRFWTRSLQENY